MFLASPNFAYSLVEFSGARGANGASHEVSSQDGIHTHTPWALGHRWIPACMPRMRGIRTTVYPLRDLRRFVYRAFGSVFSSRICTWIQAWRAASDCGQGSAKTLANMQVPPDSSIARSCPQLVSTHVACTSTMLFPVQLLSHTWHFPIDRFVCRPLSRSYIVRHRKWWPGSCELIG